MSVSVQEDTQILKAPIPLVLDEKVLMMKFREMDLRESANDTHDLSLDDLTNQISETKKRDRERKEADKPYKYVPPGGWKEVDPETVSARPPSKPDPVEKAKKSVLISKYKELAKPKIWNSAMNPGKELTKILWRRTVADGSGRRIFNLGREAHPKDIPAQWKPAPYDNDLPTPGLDPFAHHPHRRVLVKHVHDQTVRVAAGEFMIIDDL